MSSRLDPYSLTGGSLGEQYSIGSFVGFGRFSVVYRGMELAKERRVALRFVKTRATLTSSERTVLVERLRALVQPVVEIAEHAPALADLLDVTALVTSEGRWMPVLVHAWAPGQTLESTLVDERQRGEAERSLGRAIELLSPVADAIEYAHARGLVHGSLSPRAVFLRDRANVAVRDFGLSRSLDIVQAEGRALSDQPSLHTFATAYGAPEQFAGALDLGPPTDVFALALLVVELVTGSPPLGEGDDEQLAKASADPVYRPTSCLRAGGIKLGPYVESVLERALAVRPEDRYASVTSFWDALRAASRVMLRVSSSSIVPPPLPGAQASDAMPPIPRSPRVPRAVAMQSIARVETPRVQRPSARPTIPPDRFFASPETAPDDTEVESETNPLFGGLLARSVAPTSMDARSPASLEDEVASLTLGRRVAAIAAAFALGAGGAAVARTATPHRGPTHASTPLPLDVLAAASAIKPAAPPPAPTCPTGMVHVPGATVAMRDKPPREVNVAPYCIDALEVTLDQFASCSDATCRRAVTSGTTNAWPGISWWEHKTLDPLCDARDRSARAQHAMNCVDGKAAAAYCEARGARLPSAAEWQLATRGTSPGPESTKWEWTSDGPHADGAQAPSRWHAPITRSSSLGFRCAAPTRESPNGG